MRGEGRAGRGRGGCEEGHAGVQLEAWAERHGAAAHGHRRVGVPGLKT